MVLKSFFVLMFLCQQVPHLSLREIILRRDFFERMRVVVPREKNAAAEFVQFPEETVQDRGYFLFFDRLFRAASRVRETGFQFLQQRDHLGAPLCRRVVFHPVKGEIACDTGQKML